MPTFIMRLSLTSSDKTLTVGEKWFEDDPFPVGLIVEKMEITEQLTAPPGDNEEEDDDGGPIEKSFARYEVWLIPETLRQAAFEFYGRLHAYANGNMAERPSIETFHREVDKAKNVICRTIPVQISSVGFHEEIVASREARDVIHEYFINKLDIPEDESEKPSVAAPQPQLASPANGPAGARAE
jgi:hypothetical protein